LRAGGPTTHRRRRKLRLKAALLGRSRGGQTSKVHLAADRKCRPLAFVLTAGQAADSPQFIPVLGKIRVPGPTGRPRTRPDAVAGDKAYSSRGNRAHLRRRGIKAVIPEKRDQAANRRKKGSGGGRPVSHDAVLYKERNTVERLINKLKAWRGIATRYDKTPDSYLAGLRLRALMIWIKDLTRTTHWVATRVLLCGHARSRRCVKNRGLVVNCGMPMTWGGPRGSLCSIPRQARKPAVSLGIISALAQRS
jgi:transposase